MILYPTETLYAIGVHALDEAENEQLAKLKGRDDTKWSSWLVRDVRDIEEYGEVNDAAWAVIEHFLPGSLTVILRAKDTVPDFRRIPNNEISFRISPDPIAMKLITDFMDEHNAPLTCTSANVSGAPAFPTVGEILQQFGSRAQMIDQVIDDGPRKGLASTVVRIVDDDITVLREGEIAEQEIKDVLR